jgi:hypothetical protein
MLPTLPNHKTPSTQTTTMTMDTPQDHHMEALHPMKENHQKYHWFNTDNFSPPTYPKTWNRCYNCTNFITLLLNKFID